MNAYRTIISSLIRLLTIIIIFLHFIPILFYFWSKLVLNHFWKKDIYHSYIYYNLEKCNKLCKIITTISTYVVLESFTKMIFLSYIQLYICTYCYITVLSIIRKYNTMYKIIATVSFYVFHKSSAEMIRS